MAAGVNFNGFIVKAILMDVNNYPGTLHCVMMDMTVMDQWPKMLEKWRCNVFLAYNPRLYEILSLEGFDKCDLSGIKVLISGGSYLSPEMYKHIHNRFREHTKSANPPMLNK